MTDTTVYLDCNHFKIETQYILLQTLVAVREVTKEVANRGEDFFPIQPLDCAKLLVISLGTGSAKHEEIYTTEMASEWSVMSWLLRTVTARPPRVQ